MKDEELNNRRNTDSEWNWIKQNAGRYNRDNVRNLIGNERVRVTFSDKMEDSTETPSKESNQTSYYKDQVNKQTANRTEHNRNNDKPVTETPQQEIESPEPPQKPEKGDGGVEKKEKPEIRYDLD